MELFNEYSSSYRRGMYSQDKNILIADRAYEDKQTRRIMKEQGFIPVVPPKKNRKQSCMEI